MKSKKVPHSTITAKLDEGQLQALREFRDRHGLRWKDELRCLWATGKDSGYLRQVRNLVGPNDIEGVKL